MIKISHFIHQWL